MSVRAGLRQGSINYKALSFNELKELIERRLAKFKKRNNTKCGKGTTADSSPQPQAERNAGHQLGVKVVRGEAYVGSLLTALRHTRSANPKRNNDMGGDQCQSGQDCAKGV